jgi:hypothetical protein
MAGLSGGKSENEQTTGGEDFAFDQSERHRLLCQYIREKDWKTVAAFFEKKVRLIFQIFEHSESIILNFQIFTILVHRICF